MENRSAKEIITSVFRAITLAMGVAVIVLSCMGSLEADKAVTLLGIGLASGGIALFGDK